MSMQLTYYWVEDSRPRLGKNGKAGLIFKLKVVLASEERIL
ncbi:MAG: hypothetical protein N3D85_02695 [Candidatus Bathyarchaeota archaeon]|nr:hypothetical protein [Candidatus Bathyarchaeota archaeon]